MTSRLCSGRRQGCGTRSFELLCKRVCPRSISSSTPRCCAHLRAREISTIQPVDLTVRHISSSLTRSKPVKFCVLAHLFIPWGATNTPTWWRPFSSRQIFHPTLIRLNRSVFQLRSLFLPGSFISETLHTRNPPYFVVSRNQLHGKEAK